MKYASNRGSKPSAATGKRAEPTGRSARKAAAATADGNGPEQNSNNAETVPSASVERTYLQRFAVPFEYEVRFTSEAFAPDNPVLADAVGRREPDRCHRLFAIVDANVLDNHPSLTSQIQAYAAAHARRLELAAVPEVLAGGEACKNDPRTVELLLRRAAELGLDRQSFFLVVGGGALQDAAGYAAAICHRGLRVVRVPTTVASQADSGVGVKCGLNAFGVKNFVGAFAPPFAVINDVGFIDTLPVRERIAGMSEAVKVALIRDAAFFEWLCESSQALARFEPAVVHEMIRRSAELHLRHIAEGGDPFELGSARPLDFGHWLAHKLESLSGFELRHGEAVAIGMAVDCCYSVRTGRLAESDLERIVELLRALGFRLWHDALDTLDDNDRPVVLRGIDEFREHLGGDLTVTLLEGIGRGIEVHEIDRAAMAECLSWMGRQERTR